MNIRNFITGLFMMPALTANYVTAEEGMMMTPASKITESYIMLYYKSLDAPRNFYANVLGLEPTFEDEWVTLYRITSSSYVGVILEGGTAYHRAQVDNAVTLSLVVDNVDSWFERIRRTPDLVILKEIYNHESAPIRAFLIADPGGYTVEVFQWLKQ